MGKINNGILGAVSGKVAGVIGASWKGIPYLRGYAIPGNPQSAGQTVQRNKMTSIVAMAKSVLATVCQVYWNPFAVKMSGYNMFVKHNLDARASNTDYDLAVMADGSLEPETLSALVYTTGTGGCVATWTPGGLGNGLDTDKAVVVLYDAEYNVAFVDDATTRVDATASFNIGSGRTLNQLHAYLFFTRGTGETLEVSDSDYSVVTAP